MKKIIFFLLIIMAINTKAQSFEIAPSYAYHFGGKINYGSEQIKFTDSDNYGISANYILPNGVGIGFEYIRQSTTFTHDYRGQKIGTGDVNNDWYQLVGTKNIMAKEHIVPYAGLGVGAANFSPSNVTGISYSSELKFAFTLQGGVKLFLSDHIGIKLHAHMYVPIQWGGFGFTAGSGGSGAGFSAGSSFIQGDIGGGIIFRL